MNSILPAGARQRAATPEGNKNAIELFEKAVAADPRLARAWAELSGALQQSMTFGADPAVALPAALAAARRAVEIDPGDAMAHAHARLRPGACRETLPSAKRNSIRPCGSIPETPRFSRCIHPGRRRSDTRSAARRPPITRSGSIRTISHGRRGTSPTAYFTAGRFEDALRILERLPKDNYNFYSWVYRAASYAALGRSAEAKAAVSDALQHFPDLTIEGFTGNRGLDATQTESGLSGRCGPRGSRLARNPRLWRKTHNWCACLNACRNELSETFLAKRSVLGVRRSNDRFSNCDSRAAAICNGLRCVSVANLT